MAAKPEKPSPKMKQADIDSRLKNWLKLCLNHKQN